VSMMGWSYLAKLSQVTGLNRTMPNIGNGVKKTKSAPSCL